MSFETIHYLLDSKVATITLNRPEKMNSLNRTMRVELMEALRRAPDEAGVLVLTGAGNGFCSGQDLADAGSFAEINLQ